MQIFLIVLTVEEESAFGRPGDLALSFKTLRSISSLSALTSDILKPIM